MNLSCYTPQTKEVCFMNTSKNVNSTNNNGRFQQGLKVLDGMYQAGLMPNLVGSSAILNPDYVELSNDADLDLAA